ncbi:MAG TPA: hypothetical protein G4O10_01635 [Dehalococcoidia bacterium]|nr:hypothetical protein [Dehalococcoidia bacterium]
MKKRLLIIGLVLSLFLTMAVPGTAVANTEAVKCSSTTFTAVAEVAVVDPGTSTQYGLTIVTRGEKIQGQFVYADWDSMDGATLGVSHNSIIRLTPPDETGAGTFAGSAWAIIIVNLSDGAGTLFGTYRATLTGVYQMMTDGIIFDNVVDSGQFAVVGRDGSSFVTASGDWMATLYKLEVAPGVYTLAGEAEIAGEYQTLGY